MPPIMADLQLTDDVPPSADDGVWLTCIECGESFAPFDEVRYTCDHCDGLLEVRYADLPTFEDFEGEGSGVWRYHAALPFDVGVTLPEGNTPLHRVPRIEDAAGVDSLRVKHEGMNPTGSFKDRGMTVGVRVAQEVGVGRLACASTGNTSAALAAYGARGGMETLVLLPAGKVAAGKIAQAALHKARILEVDGNFDQCLDIVQDLAQRGEAYLLNSLNPFRLEGQKTIGLEIMEEHYADYGEYPDRIVLPVGNAGNTAALYKCFRELVKSGAITEDQVPKMSPTAPTPCWNSSRTSHQSLRRSGNRCRRPPTFRCSRWSPAVSASRISTVNSARRSSLGGRAVRLFETGHPLTDATAVANNAPVPSTIWRGTGQFHSDWSSADKKHFPDSPERVAMQADWSRRALLAALGTAALAGCAGGDSEPPTEPIAGEPSFPQGTPDTSTALDSAWPVPSAEPGRSNYVAGAAGPTEAVAELWATNLESSVTTPAIAGETVYVGGEDAVHALDARTGDPQWEQSVQGTPETPWVVEEPAYAPTSSGVAALAAGNGSLRWHAERTAAVPEGFVATSHGVYALTDDEEPTVVALSCFDPADGTRRWTVPADGIGESVAVVDDLAYTTDDETVRALRLP